MRVVEDADPYGLMRLGRAFVGDGLWTSRLL